MYADCQWLRLTCIRSDCYDPRSGLPIRSAPFDRSSAIGISLIQSASSHVLRMQKALNQMNLQIHHVISDITGISRSSHSLKPILAGERDPAKLAELRDGRIQSF